MLAINAISMSYIEWMKIQGRLALFSLLFCIVSLSAFCQPPGRVLMIGIDGVRPDALQAAETPALDALVANGYASFDAMNDDITISGPGWSAIHCGVRSGKHLSLIHI